MPIYLVKFHIQISALVYFAHGTRTACKVVRKVDTSTFWGVRERVNVLISSLYQPYQHIGDQICDSFISFLMKRSSHYWFLTHSLRWPEIAVCVCSGKIHVGSSIVEVFPSSGEHILMSHAIKYPSWFSQPPLESLSFWKKLHEIFTCLIVSFGYLHTHTHTHPCNFRYMF